jgi:hypothetical protein
VRALRHDWVRSLLAALLAAVLVLAPVVVATRGVATGSVALGAELGGGVPICSVAQPADGASQRGPADNGPLGSHHVHACCLLGCCTALHGLPAGEAGVAPAPLLHDARQGAAAPSRAVQAVFLRAYAARAPPVSG